MSTEVIVLLESLERELRRQECWETMPPSIEALSSTVPFCMDTMGFTQWLQWLFIPRVRAILEQGGSLPKGANMTPYAEEALSVESINATPLLEYIKQFDELMS
ncbi:MAG: YqcC family protein [Endozoicomonas sp.]